MLFKGDEAVSMNEMNTITIDQIAGAGLPSSHMSVPNELSYFNPKV